MTRRNRLGRFILALALPLVLAASPAVAQEIRRAPAERAAPALYCGSVPLTLYTQNAGNPATEFRAADFAPGVGGQRYFIDPEIGGTIEGVWFEPTENIANLSLFRLIGTEPSPNNDRIFVLELLAEPDAGPGRMTITVHFACRPGAE